jgi:hypothetical protein
MRRIVITAIATRAIVTMTMQICAMSGIGLPLSSGDPVQMGDAVDRDRCSAPGTPQQAGHGGGSVRGIRGKERPSTREGVPSIDGPPRTAFPEPTFRTGRWRRSSRPG